MKKLFLLLIITLSISCITAQTSYVWNGTTSTSFTTNTNWTPNGIPGAADNATIVTGANNCILTGNTTLTNLTITTGVLNLNGFTLNTTGVVVCNGGSCNNGTFNSTATSLTFAGTTFGANITANVTEVYFNGSTFNGSVTVTKNGAANAQCNGNNVFNGVTSITNAGTGYLLLTNGAAGRNETFNAATTFNTSNTGALYIGFQRNVTFNANVTVNNTAGTGFIQIGRVETVTLNTGVTLSCGTFAGAVLNLYNFVQNDATALSLSPGNTGGVNIYGSAINGSLTINAGLVSAQTSTFAADVNYNIGGTINNTWSSGGNVYNGVLTINNSSNGYTGFANGTADTYNADVYANNTSTTGGRIIFGNNCTSQFNGNIYVSQSGPNTAAGGIALGWGGTFPIINIAATKSIITSGTYNSGYLQLYRIQQADATAINLTTTGATNVTLNGNVFAGNFTVTAPDITPTGGTYNGAATFNKTGGTSNHNNGNLNIFNSTCTINQTSSTGYFMLGYNSADQFNDDITVTSTNIGGIRLGHNGGTGTPTLASGKTINIGGAGFSAGYLHLGSFTQLGNAAINLPMTGTTSAFYVSRPAGPCVIGGELDVTAANIEIQGGIFNGATIFTKTGGTSMHNNGNQNIFNSTLTINQQSNTGYFMLGYNSNDLFNDDITVTSTGTGGIYLGFVNGTGTPTLASGKTISVGGAGFSAGFLYFGAFTQLGSAPVNLPLTGVNTSLSFRASTFGGDVVSTSPTYNISTTTFNGIFNATKTGASNDGNPGGNIFNGVTTISNTGAGFFGLGWSLPDTWNNDVTFNNSGSERILPAWVAAGNLFNGNITVNSTGSSTGIHFCGNNAVATATLASGKTINTGTYDRGYLILNRFTQLGNAAVNLNLATGSNYLTLGPLTTIGGNFTAVAPSVNNIITSTFNGTTDISKNAGTTDQWTGGNTFASTTTILNSGAGILRMGVTSPDIFNGDVTITNSGSGYIEPSYNSAGNLYNGNITVNSTGSSIGINFGPGGLSTSTLAATKTIQIGGLGFTSGYLLLQRFTQLGSAPINLTLPVGSNYLHIGPNSTIGGDLTVDAQRINNVISSTFNGVVSITKNGNSNDAWTGGNTFNSTSTFINNTAGYLLLGNGSPDVFNGDVTFTNTGSERILPAYSSAGNLFNGNINVNSIGSSTGIHFCAGAISTVTLAVTKTIQVGGLGFTSGYLILTRFTQLGNTAVNLPLGAAANYIQFGPASAIGGNVTSTSPGLLFNGCIFSGSVNSTKTGTTNDASVGNNIFNGNSTFTDSGAGYLLFGNGNSDQFNAAVTFNNTGSNSIYVAYNSNNNIFGGVATFNNAPTANTLIYVSLYSTGSIFSENIVVTSTNGQGVQFCGGNATATATLAAGKTITIGGAGFSAGTLLLKQFTQVGATPQSLTLTGSSILQYGPTSVFNGNVTSVSPRLYFNGCTFNGSANCTKNGATDDQGVGNNIFNGTTTITSSGSGYLMFGNGNSDQFNSTATFINTGTNNMHIAYNSSNNVFGGVTTFSNSSVGNFGIFVSTLSAGTLFNDNIIVSSTNGQGIQFCTGNAAATATLAASKTISIGSAGFSAGTLLLKQFTQVGATPQSLTLTGSSILQFGPTSVFNGNVTSVSPRLYFNGCTFNGSANCTKNGATDDQGVGNNIFNGTTTITSSGSGYLMFGNGNSDQFNSTATFINTGANNMHIAYNSSNNIFGGVTTFSNSSVGNFGIFVSTLSAGTLFNENIIVSSANGQGVQFCTGNATATATLAALKTINIGAAGFSAGTLLLKQFTQVGATAQTLNQTTGSGILTLGPNSRFDGDVDFNFPQVNLNGTTYNGITIIRKNGATDNSGTGGNIFNGTTTITDAGSGHLLTGNVSADAFNGITTFNNLGSNRIYFAHNHGGQTTTFAQATTLNSAKTGGADAWSYLIAEGSNAAVRFDGSLTINIGGTLQSNLRILQGTNTSAIYNGNLNVNLTNTNANTQIQLGTVGNSTYNENIVAVNTGAGTGSGIFFNTTGTASSTLATGKTISLGAGGFTGGTLSLIRFTQLGATAQTLSQTTGTGILISGPTSTFNGDVTFNFPQLFLNGATYNRTATMQKNGATDNTSVGGNIFNGTTSITNTSANFIRLANATADNYNADVTFAQNNTGVLAPNYNTNCNYGGNVTVSAPSTYTMTFGSAAGGIATFNGTSAQSINKSGSIANPVFTRLVMNKTANTVTLNTRINISSSLTLTQGIINTTSTNILNMNDATTTSIGNSSSYINGPMNYDMAVNATSRTLNFPIGKASDWRPAVLAARHNAATSYTYKAELTNGDAQALWYTKPATVDVISQVHWWDIDRSVTSTGVASPTTNVSGNQTITLYYGINDYVTDPSFLTIVKNTNTASSTWFDIGGSGATAGVGSVTSTSAPSAFTSYSRFTLANKIGGTNPLPIELLYFTAKPVNEKVNLEWATASESNNSHFEIERSADGVNFEYLSTVNAYGNGTSVTKQTYTTVDEKPYKGISYYRLKQVDKNTEFKYADVVSVEFISKSYVNVFPNPALDKIMIKASDDYNTANIKVINTLGVEVVSNNQLTNNNGSIDLSHLANGIYYVVIQNGENTENIKISIQK